MYWIQKRLLSQNFLTNRKLVRKLIRGSSISSNDLVLEIGPGKGIITEELLRSAKAVQAIELDPKLSSELKNKFDHNSNLNLIEGNFLDIPLPSGPFKVFSNIPFNITGDVIRKLIQGGNAPQDSYLVVQREAASKFIANPQSNTMAAILYYPWWDIQVVYRFSRSDFQPQPRTDSVLLRLMARTTPLLTDVHKSLYQDFVAYRFTHDRSAKFVQPNGWLNLFKIFASNPGSNDIKAILGSFSKLQKEQQNLQKIHRSRTDKNWKKFKK